MPDFETLDKIISEITLPQAAAIDADGVFPRDTIDALAAAGLLGSTVPVEFGGEGAGLRAATEVVRRLSTACGSSAMVVSMHYAATAVLAATERSEILSEIAAGRHLTTLAFSETGSRSHFWAPVSSARLDGDEVVLDAHKSWVTSSHEADSYVWSSRPLAADGPMTLWSVPSGIQGLTVAGRFDGLGLRGNDSCPVTAAGVRITRGSVLGEDGTGLDLALVAALPWFLLLNAAASVGLMQSVITDTVAHLTRTQLSHLGQSLAQQLPNRMRAAGMRIQSDRTRALVEDTVAAVEAGREDAQLLVLEVKAAADDSAAFVADQAMVACGGAAFRKELAVERRMRDSRASRVMAPTSDALLDFVGRAMCQLPLLDGPVQ